MGRSLKTAKPEARGKGPATDRIGGPEHGKAATLESGATVIAQSVARAASGRDRRGARSAEQSADNPSGIDNTRAGAASQSGLNVRAPKRSALIALLSRRDGASIAEIVEALGWLPHTARAALSSLRKNGRAMERIVGAKARSVRHRIEGALAGPGAMDGATTIEGPAPGAGAAAASAAAASSAVGLSRSRRASGYKTSVQSALGTAGRSTSGSASSPDRGSDPEPPIRSAPKSVPQGIGRPASKSVAQQAAHLSENSARRPSSRPVLKSNNDHTALHTGVSAPVKPAAPSPRVKAIRSGAR